MIKCLSSKHRYIPVVANNHNDLDLYAFRV